MCLSFFLAQAIGCYLFITSLAMLVHQGRFKKLMHEFLASPALIAFSAGVHLILGLLIVLSHNVWISEWPVVVTIIGWIILLQGLMRQFFPETYVKMIKDLMAKTGYLLMTWIWLIVGIYLIWAGFNH